VPDLALRLPGQLVEQRDVGRHLVQRRREVRPTQRVEPLEGRRLKRQRQDQRLGYADTPAWAAGRAFMASRQRSTFACDGSGSSFTIRAKSRPV
jgi:hypothetical protein